MGDDESSRAPVGQAGLWAAFLLAQARAGREPYDEPELTGLIAAAGGSGAVTRGAAFLIGALGDAMLDRTIAAAELDPVDVVAAGVRRLHRSDVVPRAALPFAAALLTAALVSRTDVVQVCAGAGAQLGPAVEVLTALLDLVDTVSGIPGAGSDTMAAALAGVPDAAPEA